jgi:hypothetical protein
MGKGGGGAGRFCGPPLLCEQSGLALPNRFRRRQSLGLGLVQMGQSGIRQTLYVGPKGIQIDQFQQIEVLLGGGILYQVGP